MAVSKLLLAQHCYKRLKVASVACILSMFCMHPVWADDTEIYDNLTSVEVKPNLLFLLDASLSMTRRDGGSTSRLQRMISAMNTVLDNLSDDYNVGLARFGGTDGGRIIYPISDLADQGVRDDLEDQLSDLEVIFGTPTVGALEEAWRYYSGVDVRHGRARPFTDPTGRGTTSVDRWTRDRKSRVSHPDSYTGGEVVDRPAICDTDPNNNECTREYIADHASDGPPIYKSPITSECQANYVVMLSDGEPFVGLRGTVAYPDVYSETIALGQALNNEQACKDVGVPGLCGEEFATALAARDITTHSIGFNVASTYLEDVAIAGGGRYLEAESADDLVNVIDDIVSGISTGGISVVAPAVTVDQFTRLSHSEEVYLALFKPRSTVNWVGNLKKFKFNGANPTLKDANGDDAVDEATGEFLPDSQSFWSTVEDGGNVELGGAAENLDKNSRKMYSYLEPGVADLTALENRISDGNNNVTNALIGASSDAERTLFIDWLSGVDVKDEDNDTQIDDERNHIGDVLHSSPVVVDYPRDNSGLPNALVFFGTNEGFLHAIDVQNGTEEYAFMPQELMNRVPVLFEDNVIERNTNAFALNIRGAKHSSSAYGGYAPRAIDGNTDGRFNQGSVTHTRNESQPWLHVDLGLVANISEVKLWNRTDCCGGRLSNFHILVSEQNFSDGSTLQSNLSDPAVQSVYHQGTLTGDTVTIPVNTTGRYVRVWLEGTAPLSLAELEVFGSAVDSSQISDNNGKVYGMDGDLTVRTIDSNKNGFVDATEAAYLYAGMRRGGRSYHALDVSVKSTPKFLWKIDGGAGDFAELGQTWSKPVSTKIKLGNDIKDVLVFAGGYDPSQDSKETRAPDSLGRAIYMVDADTGELVWSGGHPARQPGSNKHQAFTDMTYSIPADLSVLQDVSTGFMSQIYVGDMGGRVWRFDVNNGEQLADLMDGGIIADLGVDNSVSGARRFYNSPDLALSRVDGELMLNIGIGSGYRAHPLNNSIEDHFFMLRYPHAGHGEDYGAETGTGTGVYEPITLATLYDTTSNIIAEGDDDEIRDARDSLEAAEGWHIAMQVGNGEKILGTSSTFQNVVRFVSYVPRVSTDPCSPNLGVSFFYAVNLEDGTPFEALNENETDPHLLHFRKQKLTTPGIAPPVSTIFVLDEENGKTTVTPTDVSGVNKIFEWGNVAEPRRWFWAENPE